MRACVFVIVIILTAVFSVANAHEELVCRLHSSELKKQEKFACELNLKSQHCDEFYELFEKNRASSKIVANCGVESSGFEIANATVTCGPLAFAAGISLSKFFGSGLKVNLPAALLKSLPRIGAFLALSAAPLTAYTLYDVTEQALAADKKCFEDVQGKRSVLEFLKISGEHVDEVLRPYVNKRELDSVLLPPAYLEEKFVRDLPCQQLRELMIIQKKKQDAIIGPILAKGHIKADPRKDYELSENEKELLKVLSTNSQCLPLAKRIGLICAMGNMVLGSKIGVKAYLEDLKLRDRSVQTRSSPHLAKVTPDSFADVTELRRAIPEIKDPFTFAEDLQKRRSSWNSLHPKDQDNFSMPENKPAFDAWKDWLKKDLEIETVKGNEENSKKIQKILDRVNEIERGHYPYMRSLEVADDAILYIAQNRRYNGSLTVATLYGDPTKPLHTRLQRMEDETVILTPNALSRTAIAQMALLRIRPVGVANGHVEAEGVAYTSDYFSGHDVGHIVIRKIEAKKLEALPAERKREILGRLDRIADERQRDLAAWGLYRVMHEPYPTQWSSLTADSLVSSFARDTLGEKQNPLTKDEAEWVFKWIQNNILIEIKP